MALGIATNQGRNKEYLQNVEQYSKAVAIGTQFLRLLPIIFRKYDQILLVFMFRPLGRLFIWKSERKIIEHLTPIIEDRRRMVKECEGYRKPVQDL
jgi:hypothetical protein